MIHIVFQEADVAVLQQALELDPGITGEVLQIKDDFAVGPLQHIYEEEGISRRRNWWREVLLTGDHEGLADDGTIDDPAAVAALISRLSSDPDETLWIWAAQNKHDVCGYYWLISQLREFQGRVFILYLNNLPFFNEKGSIFYPVLLADIPPKELFKARKLARPVTLSEFEIDPDEWKKLCELGTGIRLLEGGKKLVQHDETFYDGELKKFVGPEWQKASKVIHQFLHKAPHTTGDMFLLWRMKQMIAAGEIDSQGPLRAMKDFEVRAKQHDIAV